MFGPSSFPRVFPSLSLGKVVSGISKTLGMVNQIIPIYKEAKPMINNARNAINILKEFSNSTTNRVMSKKEENLNLVKEQIKNMGNKINNSNSKGPTFFQ